MATRIQVRRDTAANWAAAPTTVLASGEIGFETDTLQFKIGNNADQWQNLEYAGGTTPIIKNASGTAITDLNDASLRNNGNAKYLIVGADGRTNFPSGLTTAADGQLLVTVSKYDYLGTSAANERLLMTLTTLTTGKTYYRTYNGSWSAWYLVITGDASGNATVPGDLAVNGGDITTNQTTAAVFNSTASTLNVGGAATTVSIGASSGTTTVNNDLAVNGGDITTNQTTATVFNTTATTLNVGQAATTVSIGATTGTATIRNATTAISGAATVGSTLAVTGNTTLTGDLAVNGSDITTTSNGTATVFNTNAAALCLGEAAPTVSIGASTGTTTINNDLAVTGADITTSSAGTATLFNTNATTLNVGGAATTVSIGAATGTTTVNNDLAVNGGDITTTAGTATVFNANATTLNVGQAATTVSIGATTGTATIRNATTAISGAATVGSTLAVTGNTTLTGDLAVNGGDITTSAATATVFDSSATTVDIAGAATTLNIADAATTNQTINIGTGVTASGQTKTINIGTGGDAGSTTNINLGDADGGTVVVNNGLTVTGSTTLSGGLSGNIAYSNMPSGSIINFETRTPAGQVANVQFSQASQVITKSQTFTYTPKMSGSIIKICTPNYEVTGSRNTSATGFSGNITGSVSVAASAGGGTVSLIAEDGEPLSISVPGNVYPSSGSAGGELLMTHTGGSGVTRNYTFTGTVTGPTGGVANGTGAVVLGPGVVFIFEIKA